jgi:hypothetical protein
MFASDHWELRHGPRDIVMLPLPETWYMEVCMAIDTLEDALLQLRESLAGKAEQAYEERDAATEDSKAAYAQGEAHAYAVASAEILDAEKTARENLMELCGVTD